MISRVPYGYKIIDGRAVIDEQEAEKIKQFFRLYLKGQSMAAAARESGISRGRCTWPKLFERKEYIGTDFYPAIITREYQQQLLNRRHKEQERTRRLGSGRGNHTRVLRVFTDFQFRADPADVETGDPAETAAGLYDRIVPMPHQTKASPQSKDVSHQKSNVSHQKTEQITP